MVMDIADGEIVLVVARVHRPDPTRPGQLRILAPIDGAGATFSQVPVAEEAVFCRLIDEKHEVHAPLRDWR